MSFNGGTHEGQTGNFEKEVLSCTSYKYMRLLSVILFALVYSFFSCTRISIIYRLPRTHSLLDVKQTQPFHQLQRFWEPTKQCHTNTQTELELHKQSSNDLGGRVWSEKPGSERSPSFLNSQLFLSSFFLLLIHWWFSWLTNKASLEIVNN